MTPLFQMPVIPASGTFWFDLSLTIWCAVGIISALILYYQSGFANIFSEDYYCVNPYPSVESIVGSFFSLIVLCITGIAAPYMWVWSLYEIWKSDRREKKKFISST